MKKEDTDIQKPPHEVYQTEVEEELIDVVEATEADLWPIDVQVEIVKRGFKVVLTHNPGVPEEVEINKTYPSDADPARVAREMCEVLERKIKQNSDGSNKHSP